MSLVDINKIEAEAKAEVTKERSEKAKGKLKAKLAEIDTARVILANLERQYQDLLVTIGEGNA